MRWRFWQKLDDDTSHLPTSNIEEATEAVQESQAKQTAQEARWTDVNSVTRGLAAQRRVNHLGEMIERSMRRK